MFFIYQEWIYIYISRMEVASHAEGCTIEFHHTEKCLVGFTIRWLIQLHDLVIYKSTTYLVVVTNSDSCNDLGNTTI